MTYGTRMRLKNWKTLGHGGGGQFGRHCFHYPGMVFRSHCRQTTSMSDLPDEGAMETNVGISMAFTACNLAMSCASYLSSGHGLEF